MRRITGLFPRHNVRKLLVSILILACCGLLGACGRSQDADPKEAMSSRYRSPEACSVVISDKGLRDFLSLADQKGEGIELSLADANQLAESDVYSLWRRSFSADDPLSAEFIGRHFLIALAGLEALPDQQKDKHQRREFYMNYQETLEHRNLITAFLDEFIRSERVCDVSALLQNYLPAEELPDTLRLEFLVGLPHIRFFENVFLIDSSLAWAAGHGQLVRALSSILYKALTSIEESASQDIHGVDIMLHALRMVHFEAIPAYIDDIHEKAYDPRHKRLSGTSATMFELLAGVNETLQLLDIYLTRIRAMPAPTDQDWWFFARLFLRDNGAQSAGWFMARTIVDQLGFDHLRNVSRSTPDFFAAYQQACALLPRQTDAPKYSEEWLLAYAPALSEDNATWLDSELRRLFP